jgi:hypothetical protein
MAGLREAIAEQRLGPYAAEFRAKYRAPRAKPGCD